MAIPDPKSRSCSALRLQRGFTVMELVIVAAIVLVTSSIAIPLVQNSVVNYRRQSAIQAVTGAIKSTRFQAIAQGFPYRIVFTSATSNFQVQNDVNSNGTWADVGTPVPIGGSGDPLTLNADTTLMFRPNGSVSATTGAMQMALTFHNVTQNVSVSLYGNVSVN